MFRTIDSTDWQLIHLLQQNARESTANLARRLGLARTTVVTRLARLEREGTILGYSVRLNSEIEHTALRAYCVVSVLPRNNLSMVRSLEKLTEVEEISSISGQFDYLLILCCKNNERMDELLDTIGRLEGVKQTQTFVLLKRKIMKAQYFM